MVHPKLTIVGAGIGDPDLITVKGKKAIESAEVILYDALVHPQLLEYARKDVLKLFVGKRKGYKAYSQQDINELIVEYAEQCGHVVRLKGGDPFVFGRGREEMFYAQQHGIATDYIAGVSSAIAAAGSVGIPVTHRQMSRGFWVLTATTETGDLSPEIEMAALLDTTLVILMGLGKLEEIVRIFQDAGRWELPIAIIENAQLPTQRAIVGTVAGILGLVENERLNAPAVIVLGEVVRLNTVQRLVDAAVEIF